MFFEAGENVGRFKREAEKKNVSEHLEDRMIWILVTFNIK